MQALQFPDSRNPYLRLMRQALASQGIEVAVVSSPWRFFLAAFRVRPDVLHLHWLHPHSRNLLLTLAKFCLIQTAVLLFWIRRVRIVWTIHNLESHEKDHRMLDRLGSKLVARRIDAAIVHARAQADPVCRELGLPPEKVHHVPHGNYAGCLSTRVAPMPQHEGGPSWPLRFLYFGILRPYKGVLELIEAFRGLHAEASLTIAGNPQGKGMGEAVRAAAGTDSRIRLFLEYVDEDELFRLIEQSDVIVLPFKETFTSGSLVMAITCGKPVVVPHSASLEEYVDDSCAFLYRSEEPGALGAALQRALDSDRLDAMGENARRMSLDLDWDRIGRRVARIYQCPRQP
ncbi:MAG: glycosyltransferase [Burkholderiales bacterium]|nr:glycosyltransferase [Burkholderiales bacterium]